MKNKFKYCFGTIAFVAALSLNVILAKTNDKNDPSLKSLSNMALDEGEGDWALCMKWCDWSFLNFCQLLVGEPGGGEYWLICPEMKWP